MAASDYNGKEKAIQISRILVPGHHVWLTLASVAASYMIMVTAHKEKT